MIIAAIPAFNEEGMIAKIVVRAAKHVDKVVVVDDGSTDDTGIIAEALGAHVIRHQKNLGKGAAIWDCFDWAKQKGADVLVTLDGDGQHDPSAIPKLVEALQQSAADVVVGSRMGRPPNMPKPRWMGARMLDLATQVKVGDRVVDAERLPSLLT